MEIPVGSLNSAGGKRKHIGEKGREGVCSLGGAGHAVLFLGSHLKRENLSLATTKIQFL